MQINKGPSVETLRTFETMPVNICILSPEFVILTASAAYLQATGSRLEEILNRIVFEAFPDDPNDADSKGVEQLTNSLNEVLATKKPHRMPTIRYDLQTSAQTAEFEPRYWTTVNTPVLDEDGEISYIIHLVNDITEQVQSEQALAVHREELSEAYQELQATNEELHSSNEELIQVQWQLQQVNNELEQRVAARTHELQQEKRRSEHQRQRLANLVNHLPAGIALLEGRDMVLELVNDGMLKLWNRDVSITGKPLLVFMPELREQVFPRILDDVYTTGVAHFSQDAAVQLVIDNELQTVYMDYSYTPLRNGQGEVDSILVLAEDVTERTLSRRREQELNEELIATNEELAASNEELITTNEELIDTQESLKKTLHNLTESESKFRGMVQQAPVAIGVLATRNLIIETANDRILHLWGKPADILGKPLAVALPELEGQPFLQLLDDVYTSGETYYGNEGKAKLEHNGELVDYYFNFIYQPVKDETGATTAIIVVAVDVNEQVNARMALQRVEEMHRFSIDAANVGTWYMDLTTRELIASARMKEMFGYNADENMSLEDAIARLSVKYQSMVKETIEKAISRGEGYSIEHPVTAMNEQRERWIRATGKVYLNAEGKPSHFSGIMLDITEQKQDEQRKNDFIGMVSHELKTPLTSMRGFLQILQSKAQKAQDPFTASALEKSIKQVNKMTSMVNGFLNVSRLESGKILIDKKPFHLNELLQEMIDEAAAMQSSHIITLQASNELVINADRDKIGNVISNLLSNAIKYSPRGKLVEVICLLSGSTVTIGVKDEGMGIKPQDREKLFDRFYRVDSKHTQTISGFGIGLYLCAEIIQRHEGKIWVESEVGQGSTFWFTLPLAE